MTTKLERVKNLDSEVKTIAEAVGHVCVSGFHYLALFAIGATIVWSAVFAFAGMVQHGSASIEDILLLFIYLELGAMVGIYFKTEHMPVRFLIYIAITALTRLLIDVVSVEHKPDLNLLYVAGAILVLAGAVLVLRYGSHKYPSTPAAKTQATAADSTA